MLGLGLRAMLGLGLRVMLGFRFMFNFSGMLGSPLIGEEILPEMELRHKLRLRTLKLN